MTPPGFYTVPGSGSTLKCPSGSYRAGWAAAGAAAACESCGAGVSAITDAHVEDLSPGNISTLIAITTLSSSCCEWWLLAVTAVQTVSVLHSCYSANSTRTAFMYGNEGLQRMSCAVKVLCHCGSIAWPLSVLCELPGSWTP